MAGGRPTKYKGEETCKQVKKLAKLGAIEQDIADFFEVSLDTITEWKNAHPEFSLSLNEGREDPDELVKASLFKRAKGYSRKIKTINEKGEVIEKVEELPPDPTSMIFWLKNRKPKEWRDKQEVEHSGQMTAVLKDA